MAVVPSRGTVRSRGAGSCVAAALLASGCSLLPGASSGLPAGDLASAAAGTALGGLATLPVRGRAPFAGYQRGEFGPAWADTDRNGCDTRNDVLRRDLADVELKPGTNGCVVLAGALHDPYSGRTITFRRGAGTSEAVQIDHVVALAAAWQTGAQRLDARQRELLANDPVELLAVDGQANQTKGSGDAATWLPPNRGFRCRYVARQIAVKIRYSLWVTAAERDAMRRVLHGCPSEPLPA